MPFIRAISFAALLSAHSLLAVTQNDTQNNGKTADITPAAPTATATPSPEESAKAKSILQEAINITEKTSFKILNLNEKKSPVSIIYRQVSSNGDILQRQDFMIPGNKVVSSLIVKSQLYLISGNNVCKIEYDIPQFMQQFDAIGSALKQLASLDKKVQCAYTISDDIYKNVPCYKITVECATDNESLVKLTGSNMEYVKKNRADILKSDRTGTTAVILIDRKSKLIYSITAYNPIGRKTGNMAWGDNVEFNIPMDQTLFELPQSAHIHIIKSAEELKRATDKYVLHTATTKAH